MRPITQALIDLSTPLTAERAPTPIEEQVEAIAAAIGAGPLITGPSVGSLVTLLGRNSHTLVIFVFSVLNMIPGPPGYGGTLAIAIMVVAVALMLDKPLKLPSWIAEQRLPARLTVKLVDQLGFLAGLLARFSRPRLGVLADQRASLPTALLIVLVSLPMVIPIPFINAVPNIGIAVICVSRINRDGLGVLIGTGIAALGLGIAFAAVWGVYNLAQALLGV